MKCQKNKNLSKIEKKYNYDYDLIIRLYCMDKLYLSSYELKKCLKLRGEKKYHKLVLKGKRAVIV